MSQYRTGEFFQLTGAAMFKFCVLLAGAVLALFTNNYIGYAFSLKLWLAPWPHLTWKFGWNRKCCKDHACEEKKKMYILLWKGVWRLLGELGF